MRNDYTAQFEEILSVSNYGQYLNRMGCVWSPHQLTVMLRNAIRSCTAHDYGAIDHSFLVGQTELEDVPGRGGNVDDCHSNSLSRETVTGVRDSKLMTWSHFEKNQLTKEELKKSRERLIKQWREKANTNLSTDSKNKKKSNGPHSNNNGKNRHNGKSTNESGSRNGWGNVSMGVKDSDGSSEKATGGVWREEHRDSNGHTGKPGIAERGATGKRKEQDARQQSTEVRYSHTRGSGVERSSSHSAMPLERRGGIVANKDGRSTSSGFKSDKKYTPPGKRGDFNQQQQRSQGDRSRGDMNNRINRSGSGGSVDDEEGWQRVKLRSSNSYMTGISRARGSGGGAGTGSGSGTGGGARGNKSGSRKG
mmetsp:Transcript_6018/g.11488  ORF Transcript_6018/g.11488 Transcript_6018/m.11488 type:complete len:364 (-) Transcript_6018:124-1215(-)